MKNITMIDITMIDIARAVKWKDVKRAIKYYYPQDRNNYEKLFEEIKKYRKMKQRYKEVITISVCGMVNIPKGAEDSFYSIQNGRFSLSFVPWKSIARIPVSQDTLNHYLYEDILAHFIWEITFYGSEKKMNKTAKELQRNVSDFNKWNGQYGKDV